MRGPRGVAPRGLLHFGGGSSAAEDAGLDAVGVAEARGLDAHATEEGEVEAQTLVLDLLAYDTVRTLKGLLATHLVQLMNARRRKKLAWCGPEGFELLVFPGKKMVEDSQTLGDLQLAPAGVVHFARK